MKVNPEYLSFATHQSNNGMPMFVFAGVFFIVGLGLGIATWIFLSNKNVGGSVFVFIMGVFLSIIAFYGGCGLNQQVKGNIQDMETATGAQIISIDDTNVSSDSHGDVIIGKDDAQVNLTKNVSYIKDGKVYTNGVIVITQGWAGLFNNEEELKPILAKK